MATVGARAHFEKIRASGRSPVGAWITSVDTSTTAIFGDVGYDFIIVDREHGMIDLASAVNHIRVAKAAGMSAVVRVLYNEPALIQQALDLGADAVIVPKVATKADAERALLATKYRMGGRGFCPMVPAAGWSHEDWSNYAGQANDNILLIPLIETLEGVENFAQIGDVAGIDYAFFGLGDLSQELAIDMLGGRDTLIRYWEKTKAIADAASVGLGAPLGFGFEGVAFGTAGGDFGFLRQMAKLRLEDARA